jgi:hypothetical protein
MQIGGSSCGASSSVSPATVMTCRTAEIARNRTTGAESHNDEQRAEMTRDFTAGRCQKLNSGGGGDAKRPERTAEG